MTALRLIIPATLACVAAGCSSSSTTAKTTDAPTPVEQHTHYHVIMPSDSMAERDPSTHTAVCTGWQPADPATPVPDGYYESGDQIVPRNYNPPHMHRTPYGWVPDGYQAAGQSNPNGAQPPYPYPVYPYFHPYHPYTPYPVAAHWPYVVNHIHHHYHYVVPTPPGQLGHPEEGALREGVRREGMEPGES